MFKNVLLGFSLLCGFLLPNHINAFAIQPPLAYSWEIGEPDASAIVIPPLPTGYTRGWIYSVAIDAAGNAVMVGYASSKDYTDRIPRAYSLASGAKIATLITLPDLPDGYPKGDLYSVAINAAGNAVMVGYASNEDSTVQILLAYSWTAGAAAATQITTPLPAGSTKGRLQSVAINAAGNAVMGGRARSTDGSAWIPMAYSWTAGAAEATQITLPDLPAGYPEGDLYSVAINAAGNAVMGGGASKANYSDQIPLAYSWTAGAATQITTPLPAEYAEGHLYSVAINTAGNAVMGGYAQTGSNFYRAPLAYSWTTGDATRITTDLPDGYTDGKIKSVAINDNGNVIMAGGASTEYSYIPMAYSWKTGKAKRITTTLPSGSPNGELFSAAVNADGNAIMGGQSTNDRGGTLPLAYSWTTGLTTASAIETPPLYHEYPEGYLWANIGINDNGKAIMGGWSLFILPNAQGAFYQQPFQQ